MRKLIALFLIVSLVGCATTQGNIPRDTEAEKKYDCSSFEAAWNVYNRTFSPVEMTRKAIDDCNHVDPIVCLIVPLVPVFATAYWILGLPIVFPVFMLSPNVRENGCPNKTVEHSVDGAISNEQQ